MLIFAPSQIWGKVGEIFIRLQLKPNLKRNYFITGGILIRLLTKSDFTQSFYCFGGYQSSQQIRFDAKLLYCWGDIYSSSHQVKVDAKSFYCFGYINSNPHQIRFDSLHSYFVRGISVLLPPKSVFALSSYCLDIYPTSHLVRFDANLFYYLGGGIYLTSHRVQLDVKADLTQ